MTQEPVNLEIGVGEDKKNSRSLGLDIRRSVNVDILSDARFLPFKDSSIDSVYAAHVLEHFSHRETGSVIREWTRVLKPGGSLELRCPDLRIRALLFFFSPGPENVRNIYGGQEYPENYHRSGFSYGMLKEILKDCGITCVRRIFDGYKGIPGIPADLHLTGTKKEEKARRGK